MVLYRTKRFAILSLIYTLGITSLFAASDVPNIGLPQEHLEVQVHSKANAEFNFPNTLFLAPLKYQVKNEHLYKISSESTHEMFAVQLYKDKNYKEISLSFSNFINFINTPIKPKGLVTINILNSFKITLLPFFDWKALRYNDFYYSRNHLTPKTNSITLFQIEDQ